MYSSIRNSFSRHYKNTQESCLDITPGAALLFPLLYYFDTDGWFAAVLPAVFFHELGHYAALRFCGGEILFVRLEIWGLRMDASPFSSLAEEAFCAAAGPAAGLLWSLAALRIHGNWWEKSALSALLINLFNLLPALPLDGGRVLFALTGSRRLLRITGLVSCIALSGWAAAVRRLDLIFPAVLLFHYAIGSE